MSHSNCCLPRARRRRAQGAVEDAPRAGGSFPQVAPFVAGAAAADAPHAERVPQPSAQHAAPPAAAAAAVLGGGSAPATEVAAPRPSPAPQANAARDFLRAVKDGDVDAVFALCREHGAAIDLERRSMWENTPLLCAAYYGHEGVALRLLELGASAGAANEHGCTALLFAVVEALPRLTGALLARADVDPTPAAAVVYSRATDETAARTPFLAAAEAGFSAGVEALLARAPELALATEPASPLALAARRGHASVCRLLLRAGALPLPEGAAAARAGAGAREPGGDGSGAAAAGGEGAPAVEIARAPESALRLAIAHGHAEAAAVIADAAPHAARAEPSLLPLAAARGLAPACDALLRAGVPADARAGADADAGRGGTALHVAARRNDAAVAALLLEHGADAAAADAEGRTASDVADANGHADVARVLRRAPACGQAQRGVADATATPANALDDAPPARKRAGSASEPVGSAPPGGGGGAAARAERPLVADALGVIDLVEDIIADETTVSY